jgi:hypothetical protein
MFSKHSQLPLPPHQNAVVIRNRARAEVAVVQRMKKVAAGAEVTQGAQADNAIPPPGIRVNG